VFHRVVIYGYSLCFRFLCVVNFYIRCGTKIYVLYVLVSCPYLHIYFLIIHLYVLSIYVFIYLFIYFILFITYLFNYQLYISNCKYESVHIIGISFRWYVCGRMFRLVHSTCMIV